MTPDAVFVESLVGQSVTIAGFDFIATSAKGTRLTLALCDSTLEADRLRCGLTQKEVAAQLGVTQGLVSKLESGQPSSAAVRSKLRLLYHSLQVAHGCKEKLT